ncbi:ParA family protein [Desulfococcaceae bacterium HSG9]|nr:ParA family protein [Desulfococcaceae bacterium HSG9]
MGHTICIVSQKGGVGKTITAVNLAAALAIFGKRTLLIDCDPQGSATASVGINDKKSGQAFQRALQEINFTAEIITHSCLELLKVIPAPSEILQNDATPISMPGNEKFLHTLLARFRADFDYIIIDTAAAPASFMAINAIITSDSVLIPLQCELLAFQALRNTLRTLIYIKNKHRLKLKLEGVLLTMYDKGEDVSERIVQSARKHIRHRLFKTVIPRSVQLRESASFGRPLVVQNAGSSGAQSYIQLAKEILAKKKG